MDPDRDDEKLPLHAAPAEDAEDINVPWTLHVANAVIRVTTSLLSQLVSKMFFQMLIEWSDTPCLSLELREGGDSEDFPSVSLVCSSHSQICQGPRELARGKRRVLEVGRSGFASHFHSSLPANDIYVSLKMSFACPLEQDIVLRFWRIEEAMECVFAAAALALHAFNVDRAFWSTGPGGWDRASRCT